MVTRGRHNVLSHEDTKRVDGLVRHHAIATRAHARASAGYTHPVLDALATWDTLFHALVRVPMDLSVGWSDGSLFSARKTFNRSFFKVQTFSRRYRDFSLHVQRGIFSATLIFLQGEANVEMLGRKCYYVKVLWHGVLGCTI